MRITFLVLSIFLSFASCSRSPPAVADAQNIDNALERAERERTQAELRAPAAPIRRRPSCASAAGTATPESIAPVRASA